MRSSDRAPSELTTPKQPHIIAIFSIVGMTMTGLMAVIGFINGDLQLASFLAFASVVYGLSLFLYQSKGKEQLSSTVLIYTLYGLMFYLVYTGGVEWTGILWLYIVAPVTVYLRGLKRGILDTGLFLIVVAFLMNVDSTRENYPAPLQLRFFLSFLTVTFLSAMYEYSRAKWYKHTVELTKRYQKLAHYDPLTNLSNRRHATIIMEKEYARLKRGGEPVSIMVCDIDHFKSVNDKYGHCAGDVVLKQLAELFNSKLRNQDTAARWGGEEFIIVLPQTTKDSAREVANKLLLAVKEHTFLHQQEQIEITISIGLEQLTLEQSLDACINSADTLLYQAKNAGRNRIFG